MSRDSNTADDEVPGRELGPKPLKRLNQLVAEGSSFADAMSQVRTESNAWRTPSEPGPPTDNQVAIALQERLAKERSEVERHASPALRDALERFDRVSFDALRDSLSQWIPAEKCRGCSVQGLLYEWTFERETWELGLSSFDFPTVVVGFEQVEYSRGSYAPVLRSPAFDDGPLYIGSPIETLFESPFDEEAFDQVYSLCEGLVMQALGEAWRQAVRTREFRALDLRTPFHVLAGGHGQIPTTVFVLH